jgi:dihydroorotase
MSSLETAYAALRTSLPGLSTERTVELLSSRPRELFGLEQPVIAEGNEAVLSFFDPAGTTTLTKSLSKSANNPFLGRTLQGRALGILNGTHLYLNEPNR